jgi:hypothetical protein
VIEAGAESRSRGCPTSKRNHLDEDLKMPIPSLKAFEQETRLDSSEHFFTRVRGKSITKIDTLIKEFHVWLFQDESRTALIAASLLAECARWLKAKATKTSKSSTLRRLAIEKLAKEAFLEIKQRGNVTGVDHFNLRKTQNMNRDFKMKARCGRTRG